MFLRNKMPSCFRHLLALIGFEVGQELSNYGQEKLFGYLQSQQKSTPPNGFPVILVVEEEQDNAITEHE